MLAIALENDFCVMLEILYMYEFKLADLGEGMHEAEIAEWLINIGDTLKLDQPMVKVETDKALVEIPSPIAGTLSEIRVQSGQTAKVGDVLAILDAPDTSDTKAKNTAANAASNGASTSNTEAQFIATVPTSSSSAQSSAPTNAATATTTAPKSRVLAAPAVRKLAFELGVDLEQITPSGASGRVSLDDVRSYAEHTPASNVGTQFIAPVSSLSMPLTSSSSLSSLSSLSSSSEPSTTGIKTPASQADERQPLTGLRKRIAEHMERSWRIVPHATAFGEVDGGALIALRETLKPVAEQRGVRLTYMPLLIKLLIPLLKEFSTFNASLDEEKREIVYKHSYHIGLATDSPEGLLVPVLRDADRLTLVEIADKLEKLIEGARKRTLTPSELSGSTFTLNNVGSFGGSSGTPIINYPEVAILAVGRMEEKAIVRHGSIIARPIMPLALSFDHRLIDGAMAGRFLNRFAQLVENPQQLMLDMV
jgi:pyruvate dehydrogenase E2 component (dihydrolipoamide acetyltransferase)